MGWYETVTSGKPGVWPNGESQRTREEYDRKEREREQKHREKLKRERERS